MHLSIYNNFKVSKTYTKKTNNYIFYYDVIYNEHENI
jgi:hypothetical protein